MIKRLMRKREDGFTAAELIVACGLVAVVAAITFGFVDQTTKVSNRTTRSVQTERDTQLALRVLTQDIRGANPISATYPTAPSACPPGVGFPPATAGATGYTNCLRFALTHSTSAAFCLSTEFGKVPRPYSIVTYGLRDNILYEDRTDYTTSCTTPSRNYKARPVLRDVMNASTGTPLFTYYDDNGRQLANNVSVTDAGSVRVTLVVQFEKPNRRVTLSNVATVRNNRGDRG